MTERTSSEVEDGMRHWGKLACDEEGVSDRGSSRHEAAVDR